MPVIALSIIYCALAIDRTKENQDYEVNYALSEIAINIDKCFEQASATSDSIYYDNDLMNILKSKDKSKKQYIDLAEQIDKVAAFAIRYEFIENIVIYSHNSNLYRSGVLRYIDDAKVQDEWYDKYVRDIREFCILTYEDKETGKNKISMIRKLNNIPGVNDILKIDISSAYIKNLLKCSKVDSKLTLIDTNEKEIVAEGECLKPCDRYKMRIEHNLTFPDYYMLRCDYNLEGVANQLVVFFLVLIVILILSFLALVLLIRPIISKLNLLTSSVEDIKNGRYTRISEKDLGNDEIGTLIRGYNSAVKRIDVLINEVYSENLKRVEIENEKNKAQFMLLKGQLNPHFIFNLFEIMRMNAMVDGNREISNLIYEMSNVIRNILLWKSDIIELKSEMEMVKSYLDLVNYSFENRLDISINTDEAALKCSIPKMSVQVLVENAVRHGLDHNAKDKKIQISAYCESEKLIIKVADNGIGMSEEYVEAINNRDFENASLNFGVGISNVTERLRIYYGEEASLRVSSKSGEKTEFVLELPISNPKGGPEKC